MPQVIQKIYQNDEERVKLVWWSVWFLAICNAH